MLGGIFEKNKIKDKIEKYNKKIEEQNFWKDKISAQKILKEKNFLENIFSNYNSTVNELENLEQLIELAESEKNAVVIKDCEKKINLLLNQIKKTEVKCFLSGDNRINQNMATLRNIDFHASRGIDKATFLNDFETRYGVKKADMLYIGDDLYDKSVMEGVGHAYCPSDAVSAIRSLCSPDNVLSNKGGDNVVCEMVEMLLDRGLIEDCTVEDII